MEFDDVTYTHVVLLPKQNLAATLLNTLKKVSRVVQDKFWLVLLTTVTSLVVAFVWNETKAPRYQAQALLVTAPQRANPLIDSLSGFDLYKHEVQKKQFWQILSNPTFVASLAESPDVRTLLAAESSALPFFTRMQNGFAVQENLTTNPTTLNITMIDTNPRLAFAVVKAFAQSYNDFVKPQNFSIENTDQLTQWKWSAWKIFYPELMSEKLPSTARSALTNEIIITSQRIQDLRDWLTHPESYHFPALSREETRVAYQNLVLAKLNFQSLSQNLGQHAPEVSAALLAVQTQTQIWQNLVLQNIEQDNLSLQKLQTKATWHSAEGLANLIQLTRQNHFPFFSDELHLQEVAALPTQPLGIAKSQRLLLALLCGILSGCLFAALIGFQDEKIHSATDLETRFHIPVLGVIPPVKEAA